MFQTGKSISRREELMGSRNRNVQSGSQPHSCRLSGGCVSRSPFPDPSASWLVERFCQRKALVGAWRQEVGRSRVPPPPLAASPVMAATPASEGHSRLQRSGGIVPSVVSLALAVAVMAVGRPEQQSRARGNTVSPPAPA